MQLAIEFKLPDIDPTYKAMRKQKAKEVRGDRKRRKNNYSSNQSVVASYNGLHRKLSGNPEVEGAEELWDDYNSYMLYSYFGVNKN